MSLAPWSRLFSFLEEHLSLNGCWLTLAHYCESESFSLNLAWSVPRWKSVLLYIWPLTRLNFDVMGFYKIPQLKPDLIPVTLFSKNHLYLLSSQGINLAISFLISNTSLYFISKTYWGDDNGTYVRVYICMFLPGVLRLSEPTWKSGSWLHTQTQCVVSFFVRMDIVYVHTHTDYS